MNNLCAWLLINDVTTSPDSPPEYVETCKLSENCKRDMTYPAKNAKYYRDLRPLYLGQDLNSAFECILKEAENMANWTITSKDFNAYRIEIVAKTPLIRFRDDLVIEVRPSGIGSEIHMRSKSRIGKGDFGTNARRIREFLDRIKSSRYAKWEK